VTITWSDARAKVRGDLWRSASGLPDDVVDRALHSSLREIEAKRRWLWLENVVQLIALPADSVTVALPSDLQSVVSMSYRRTSTEFFDPPMQRVSVTEAQMLASGITIGWPTKYGVSGLIAYLDCIAQAGGLFSLIYNSKTPTRLEDAIAAGYIATLDLQQDLVIAGACSRAALTFLKDETNAGRHQAKFERMIESLQDEDDAARTDITGPRIMPDTTLNDTTR
jgi:hypothetical protein